MALFLAEACLLSVGGGVLGVAVGLGGARLLAMFVPGLPVETPHEFVVAAIVVSIVVGLSSGAYPARRASRLDPVDALRSE